MPNMGDMTPLTVYQWAQERSANAQMIAESKTGADRVAWLQDVGYWQQIVAALAPAPPTRSERYRFECVEGAILFTDEYGAIWRVTPTGDPHVPVSIAIVQRGPVR